MRLIDAEANKRIEALENEVAELKAESSDYAVKAINIHNQDSSIIRTLRNVLNSFDIHDSTGLQPLWVTTMSAEQIDKALSATPAESLQSVINETIEMCAEEVEERGSRFEAEIIRALKDNYDR